MKKLPQGTRLELDRLEPDPNRILIEYDGPRFFGARLEHLGLDVLAFFCEEADQVIRYLVVPTTMEIIEGLDTGSLTVRESLTRTSSRPWLVDIDATNWSVREAVAVEAADLPDGYLPKPHLMLRAELQPLLTLRLEGPDLTKGSTPRDAALYVFRNVPEALKRLLDHVLERGTRMGRPQDSLRTLYGLPAQRFAFSSFEVAFRRPDPGVLDRQTSQEALRELSSLFEKTLLEAAGTRTDADDDERRVLLEAAYKLAPPTRGIVHSVKFAGAMVGHGARQVVLTRKARTRVRRAMQELERPFEPLPFFDLEGHVGDIDFDALTLELRDVTGMDVERVTVHFEPDFLDEVTRLAADGTRIRILGERSSRGKHDLLAVFEVPHAAEVTGDEPLEDE
jgi:hypothetical protein